MTKLELWYWDFHGGRGETARVALTIGGIDFVDHRIKFQDWPALKPEMPFNAVPVLAIDGARLAQSNSINRYVGKLTGLYPEDPIEQLRCDETMDAVEDISPKIVATFGLKDDALKKAREELTAGPLTTYLKNMERCLSTRGDWFADNRLTVADLKLMIQVRHVMRGGLDHVPSSLIKDVSPGIAAHFDRVNADPRVRAYYDPRGL